MLNTCSRTKDIFLTYSNVTPYTAKGLNIVWLMLPVSGKKFKFMVRKAVLVAGMSLGLGTGDSRPGLAVGIRFFFHPRGFSPLRFFYPLNIIGYPPNAKSCGNVASFELEHSGQRYIHSQSISYNTLHSFLFSVYFVRCRRR